MGGCLSSTPSREFKNQNEGSIQHHTMNAARRSTFWENAVFIEEEKQDTESELHSTFQTWASMNLYEHSTTQNARMTQSKMKPQAGDARDVEPSDTATEVQKDFDINSPIASETFSKNALDNMFTKTSTLDDPQTSFEMTPAQSLSDMAKVVSKTKEDAAPRPLSTPKEVGSMEVTEEIAHTPVLYDASVNSYSVVDEFDEPAEEKLTLVQEQSVDSFDKLLADPSVRSPDGNFVMVNTASGRWGLVSRDDILKNGRHSDKPTIVKYMNSDDEDQLRRTSSFEIRAYRSFVI